MKEWEPLIGRSEEWEAMQGDRQWQKAKTAAQNGGLGLYYGRPTPEYLIISLSHYLIISHCMVVFLSPLQAAKNGEFGASEEQPLGGPRIIML